MGGALAQPAHFGAELLRLAGVVAIGDDHHGGARIIRAVRASGWRSRGCRRCAYRRRSRAIRPSWSTARVTSRSRREADTCASRCGTRRLRLAERIDDAVQEAHEERGVEVHRARCIEQHDQAERLDLAPPPGEIDRRAAVTDVAVDGAAQVKPSPAPPHLLAAHQPCPHAAGEPRRERIRPRDIVRIGYMTQIGGDDVFGAGSALTAPAPPGRVTDVFETLDVIGQAGGRA